MRTPDSEILVSKRGAGEGAQHIRAVESHLFTRPSVYEYSLILACAPISLCEGKGKDSLKTNETATHAIRAEFSSLFACSFFLCFGGGGLAEWGEEGVAVAG